LDSLRVAWTAEMANERAQKAIVVFMSNQVVLVCDAGKLCCKEETWLAFIEIRERVQTDIGDGRKKK
jgi:hypothetical protein